MSDFIADLQRKTLPAHAQLWPDTATVDANGRLRLAGIDASAPAHEYGTPLYVFDEATLRGQCQSFRRAFAQRWPESAIAYAGKAYLAPALCALLAEEGLELDTVSAGEFGVALASGYPAARIHLHGNFKPDAELAAALDAGIGRIVVDSLDELARVEALAREQGRPAAIWLRLCPDVPTETHAYTQTGHADSKFGLDVASGVADEAAARAIASPWLDLAGLHAHVGSQLFDMRPAAEVVTFLCAFAARLRDEHGANIRELSPGGGLGVAYASDKIAPTIDEYAEAVTDALHAAIERHRLASPRLIVEPGRAIVARAGVALYTVGPRKAVPGGTTFVAVDGGMGENPRPALYGVRYTAVLAERMRAPAAETVRIVGRYCESGDVLVEAAELPVAAPGELLAIPVSGAYHLPMASNYNLVPRPAVVWVRDGQARLARRRETLDDLLRLEQS
ncbi:MAG: Diaminopimelate decarboxylase [Ktedonobacterales bacterium]|nr:MAG: Diaminopimelate decarboxylase [Ktedonobacterales bacterium]